MGAPRPAAADLPIGEAEFAQLLERLGPFERAPRLAVGVSGGADSTALALLVRDWVARRGGSVLALIVDHRLRDGSSADAELAAARMNDAGIAARVLAWTGPKPDSGIQATARAIRYELLADACRDLGILHLLVAHHRDDQAETIQLRQDRGSGTAGLAGMPAVREWPRLRLLRPLLDVPCARLLATTSAARQDFLRDPANDDHRFARARLRSSPTFDRAAAFALAPGAAEWRLRSDRSAAAFLAGRAAVSPLGYVTLDYTGAEVLAPDVIARLITVVSGAELPPRGEAIRRLVADLARPEARVTLGGAILQRTGDSLTVSREPAAASEVTQVRAGERYLWDMRFTVELPADAPAMTLKALGSAGRTAIAKARPVGLQRVPGPALRSLPSLWVGNRLVWQPLPTRKPQPDMLQSAICRFTPTRGLVEAPFASVNVVSNGCSLIYPLSVGGKGVGMPPAADLGTRPTR